MEHNFSDAQVGGSAVTGLCMSVTAMANLVTFMGGLNEFVHLIATCTAIGAACTTMVVGLLTIRKLRREK